MDTTFNFLNQLEKPSITLCNPNGEQLYQLELAFNVVNSLRFNAVSDLLFSYPKSIDNGNTELDGYELIKNKRLILLDNKYYYIISNVKEDLDGSVPMKEVDCQSIDAELINKKLMVFSYTSIKFYDLTDPTDTLLDKIIEYLPSWSVGSVDAELLSKYRSFDVSDTTIYNFLMTDVEEAFECIFTFDYENRTISATTIDNSTTSTDIFLGFDNLISSATFEEKSDEITTHLRVYGGNELDVRSVNPLGNNSIYNFDYYKTTEWMTSGLISAINAWEALVETKETSYASNLVTLRTAYENKSDYETDMVELEAELAALETTLAAAIESGQSTSSIKSSISSKNAEITSKQSQIDGEQSNIDNQLSILEGITDELSFDNNFTDDEYLELSKYMYENTYQNENIIKLDSMTPAQIQDQSQELYDQATNVLGRLSQPRYEFSIDSANFVALPEYASFTSELELGCIVTAELKDGDIIQAVLLELEIDYDNLDSFEMTFSNRLRLDGDKFVYSDLMGSITKTGANVNFNSEVWSNWDKYHKDEVSTFIDSALDASTNKIINSSAQNFTIDQTGLRGRKVSGSDYDDKQVWITNNVIGFTNDAWDTSSLAIGNIEVNGQSFYGLVGDAIVGNMLLGNSLKITNDDESLNFDQTGLTIDSNRGTISINTTNGIIIENNSGTDVLSADVNGNISIIGNITATGGNIGGFSITSTSIYKDGTHYFDSSTNTLKWGNLSVVGNTVEMTGTIHATSLDGTLDWSNLTNVPANQIDYGGGSGYLSGGAIYGGNPTVDNLYLGSARLVNYSSGIQILSSGSSSYVAITDSGSSLKGGSSTLLVTSSGLFDTNQTSDQRLATRGWTDDNYADKYHTHAYASTSHKHSLTFYYSYTTVWRQNPSGTGYWGSVPYVSGYSMSGAIPL